jgi:hypothetical protein
MLRLKQILGEVKQGMEPRVGTSDSARKKAILAAVLSASEGRANAALHATDLLGIPSCRSHRAGVGGYR